jgi:hypothetical protein
MMGQLKRDQEQLFYSFRLDEVVPDDHLARAIAAVLDLSWVHAELASYYPKIGRSAAAAAEFIKKKNRRPGPTRSARIPVKRTNKTSLLRSATASRSVAQQNPTATSSLPELVTQNLASATPAGHRYQRRLLQLDRPRLGLIRMFFASRHIPYRRMAP